MRITSLTILATGLISMALMPTAWCGDDEVTLTKADVPAVVLAALEKAANGNALSEFEKEKKHHKVVYTAEYTGANGTTMEVTVAEDGTVLAVEAEGGEKEEKDGKDGKEGKEGKDVKDGKDGTK